MKNRLLYDLTVTLVFIIISLNFTIGPGYGPGYGYLGTWVLGYKSVWYGIYDWPFENYIYYFIVYIKQNKVLLAEVIKGTVPCTKLRPTCTCTEFLQREARRKKRANDAWHSPCTSACAGTFSTNTKPLFLTMIMSLNGTSCNCIQNTLKK
jgi:hypothetical protein